MNKDLENLDLEKKKKKKSNKDLDCLTIWSVSPSGILRCHSPMFTELYISLTTPTCVIKYQWYLPKNHCFVADLQLQYVCHEPREMHTGYNVGKRNDLLWCVSSWQPGIHIEEVLYDENHIVTRFEHQFKVNIYLTTYLKKIIWCAVLTLFAWGNL